MIQNLLVAIGIATANVVAPNINTDKKEIQNVTQITVGEAQFTINWQQVANTLDGQPNFILQSNLTNIYNYNIECAGLQHRYSDDHWRWSYYIVITPIENANIPNDPYIKIRSEYTVTGEIGGYITQSTATQLNVANRDDIYFPIGIMENTHYEDVMQQGDFAWDGQRIIDTENNYYEIDLTNEETFRLHSTMQDGKIRISTCYDLDTTGTIDSLSFATSYLTIPVYITPTEIVDIPGLMFTILGMPFSFISQAFNLTLFPGTKYQVNVANIIFAIIGALLVIIVLKKVLGR